MALLRNEGYRLSVLGVGTRHGAPVLLPDGGFLQDRDGEIVIPILDEGALRGLAGSGGGIYVRLTKDDQDTRQLTGFFSETQAAGEQAGAEITADVWREQGPWLVLCLLPLVALLFRRGYVLALALLLFPLPEPVSALDWDDLWLRRDQQGQRAMDARDYAAAAQLFDDPAWKAAAQHRAGDYQSALGSLEPLAGAQNNYNRGNALARLGRYHEAIAAYDRTLAERPDHADAKFNKELLEKELERQQQQQDQETQQEQDQQQSRQGQDQQQSRQGQDQQGQGNRKHGREQQQAGQERQNDQPQPPVTNERQDRAERGETPQPDTERQAQTRQQQEQGRQARDEGLEQSMARADDPKTAEEQQATEQWLRRIPDDPSGLLRRKFLYQYQQRNYERNRERQTW